MKGAAEAASDPALAASLPSAQLVECLSAKQSVINHEDINLLSARGYILVPSGNRRVTFNEVEWKGKRGG